jgi:hypothetical protein
MLTRSFAACLLAASSAFVFCAAPASVRADDDAADSLVKLVDVAIQDVDVVEGELVATAKITLDVVGRKLVRTVDLPIDVGATAGESCDILNLSLGPIRLDVLGLRVRLDDCEGGPVTVDIGADPNGGILGDLLCSIAGRLVAGDDLQTIFDELDPEDQDSVRLLLEFLLSDALGGSLTDCHNLADTQAHAAAAKKRKNCDLLTLEIPEGVHLALLGLTVDTSGICLDVWARRGDGNLLGNLLCSLSELLDKPGASLGRIRNLTNRIRDAVIDQREMSL